MFSRQKNKFALFLFNWYWRHDKKERAVQAVVRRGRAIVPRLIEEIEKDWDIFEKRPGLIKALGGIGDSRAIPFLMEFANNYENRRFRVIIADTLAKFNDPLAQEYSKRLHNWIKKEDAKLCYFVYGMQDINADGYLAALSIFLGPYSGWQTTIYEPTNAWCIAPNSPAAAGLFERYALRAIFNPTPSPLPPRHLLVEQSQLSTSQQTIRKMAMNYCAQESDESWPHPPYFVCWDKTKSHYIYSAQVEMKVESFAQLLPVQIEIEQRFSHLDASYAEVRRKELDEAAKEMTDFRNELLPFQSSVNGETTLGILQLSAFVSPGIYDAKIYALGHLGLLEGAILYRAYHRERVWLDRNFDKVDPPPEVQEIATILELSPMR